MSSLERQALPTERFLDPRYAVVPPDGHLSEIQGAQHVMFRTNPTATRHMDRISTMMGKVLEESGFNHRDENDARIITIARVAGQIHDLGKIKPDADHGSLIGALYKSQGAGYVIGAHGIVLTRGLELPDREIVAAVCERHHQDIPEGYASLPNRVDQIACGITALLKPLDLYEQLHTRGLAPEAIMKQVFVPGSQAPIIAGREIDIEAYIGSQPLASPGTLDV